MAPAQNSPPVNEDYHNASSPWLCTVMKTDGPRELIDEDYGNASSPWLCTVMKTEGPRELVNEGPSSTNLSLF